MNKVFSGSNWDALINSLVNIPLHSFSVIGSNGWHTSIIFMSIAGVSLWSLSDLQLCVFVEAQEGEHYNFIVPESAEDKHEEAEQLESSELLVTISLVDQEEHPDEHCPWGVNGRPLSSWSIFSRSYSETIEASDWKDDTYTLHYQDGCISILPESLKTVFNEAIRAQDFILTGDVLHDGEEDTID